MERSDIGTNGLADDASFDRNGSEAGNTGLSASSTAATTTADASGDTAGVGTAGITDGANAGIGTPTEPSGKLNMAKQKLGAAKEKVVDRMHVAADWIKEKDIDQVRTGIEQQVRDHPARTLMIAVGLGYLIGRAFRGNGAA